MLTDNVTLTTLAPEPPEPVEGLTAMAISGGAVALSCKFADLALAVLCRCSYAPPRTVLAFATLTLDLFVFVDRDAPHR